MRVGVIDVGTNSVRLLVADGMPLREVVRDLTITRLGEGVDRARVLGAEPLRRTVAAIAGYTERARTLGADHVRVIATSAVRDAGNRDAFLTAVRRAAGIDADVLTGEQEARLGFLGATLDLDARAPRLVVDIGGGSTEIVRGDTEAERWISLDVGSVRLTERHVHTDPPRDDEIAAVARDADAALAHAVEAVGAETPATLIGLAGTITTVTAVVRGLPAYDRARVHHATLSLDEIRGARERLAAMRRHERAAVPVMPPGREDVIVAGVVILERIMARFRVDRCVVSESDILDGAAASLIPSAGDAAGR